MYFVYLLKTNHPIQIYYIGSTPNLKRRISEHLEGKSDYTKSRLPVKLIYFEGFSTKELALEREKKLKKSRSTFYALLKRLHLK